MLAVDGLHVFYGEIHALKGAEGARTVEIHPKEGDPFTALVFKTTSETHVGEVSYFRTFSGTIATGDAWTLE